MANLLSLLNERIRRLARREIRAQTRKTRRLTAQHRRDLAGMAEFVPHVWWRLKGRPYAAVVIAPDGIDGLAWTTSPQASERIAGLNVDGRLIKPGKRRWWHWERKKTYG